MVTTRVRAPNAKSGSIQNAPKENLSEGLQLETPKRNTRTSKKPKLDHEDGGALKLTAPSIQDKAEAELIVRRKGKGGKLRNIMNMPIDIFAEVCFYLDPLDLHHLARTNKRIRSILMTKEAKRIWAAALSSVPNFPECPTDLNEPQYVRFMYSSECDTPGCNARGTQVDWFYRLRFCKGCFDIKMTDGIGLDKTFYGVCSKSWFSQIIRHLDSSQRYNFNNPYRPNYERTQRPFYVEDVRDALETYQALRKKPNYEELVELFMKQLSERGSYRTRTGSAMEKWHLSHMASVDKQVEVRKNARFESVKEKLLEAGWNLVDLPPKSCKEFRALAFKDQKLTPKVWQNIEPKLELLLQKQRDARLEKERIERRLQRSQAVSYLYLQTASETLGLYRETSGLRRFIPKQSSITALPRVEEMLEADTDTITNDQWLEVVYEVRALIWLHLRSVLRQIIAAVETSKGQPGGVQNKIDDDDSAMKIAEDIQAMMRRLSRVTAAFVCMSSTCMDVQWFPDSVPMPCKDLHWFHLGFPTPCYSAIGVGTLFQGCEPLNEERKQLVKRMVVDLGLEVDTATRADVQGLENLICARCDLRVAKYMSFSQIATHYMQGQRWFCAVKEATQTDSNLHTFIDDHDWISNGTALVRQDNQESRASLELSQAGFRRRDTTDPACDMLGIGGEDFRSDAYFREIKRYCKLCPSSFSPAPCPTSVIEIHIRAKHGKTPNLETDTSSDRLGLLGRFPCPT